MMRALEAGGLEAVYNEDRDRLNQKFGDSDYKPNEGGFYELTRWQYMEPGFPRMHQGKLIKDLYGGITRIVAGDYRIIYMHRDAEEVRQSHEAFFSRPPPHVGDAYYALMEDTIGILRQRRDVQLTVLWYRDVVDKPFKVFQELGDIGCPIDPTKAAAVVNPNLCRFRFEELEVGVR